MNERFGDRIAVDDGDFKLNYADLRHRAYALAAELAKTAQSDRPIAAIIPGNAVYPIALLATAFTPAIAAAARTTPRARRGIC